MIINLLIVSLLNAYAIDLADIDIASIDGFQALNIFMPDIEGYEKQFAYEDRYVKEQLKQDLTMAFRYSNGSKVMYVGLQISKDKHLWEDSLIYEPIKEGKPQAKVIAHKEVTIINDPLVKGVFFVFIRPNSTLTEAVLYWFEYADLNIKGKMEDRNIMISLWNYPSMLERNGMIKDSKDMDEVERFYVDFAKPIAMHIKALIKENGDNYIYYVMIIGIVATIAGIFIGVRLYNRLGS